jgi:hypothetical protein
MIHFYGLLHLDENQRTAANAKLNNFSHLVDSYIRNAVTLARTLAFHEIQYTLLTNRPDLVNEHGVAFSVKKIPFEQRVPSGIPFYSAHHKIDAFKYLAEIEDEYSVLCDLDVICINRIPKTLENMSKMKIPVCYDISDQVVPAYGQKTIIRDLESIIESESEGKWYGGEFIGGTSEFFSHLYSIVETLMPSYLSNLDNSHHIGDEAIVSPAIELLRKQFYIADGGRLGIVTRFWNCSVLHPQKPFSWCRDCFLMHLPADKLLLAEASSWTDCELKCFSSIYESMHLLSNSMIARIKRKAVLKIMRAKELLLSVIKEYG